MREKQVENRGDNTREKQDSKRKSDNEKRGEKQKDKQRKRRSRKDGEAKERKIWVPGSEEDEGGKREGRESEKKRRTGRVSRDR